MQATIHADSSKVVLKITGSLTFGDNKEWRDSVLEALGRSAAEHVLDLTALEDLDSAGLGMMLAMQKWAKDRNCNLRLKYDANSQAGGMIRLSKFDSMFDTING